MSSQSARDIIAQFSNWAVISLFFLAILSPATRMLMLPRDNWSPSENRLLAALPPPPKTMDNVAAWRSGIDAYLSDHFGFRQWYIRHYQHQLIRFFDVIPASVPVLKGRGGWYFFTMFGLIDDFYGRTPLKRQQIQAWIAAQEAKKRWLEERGIRYLLLIPPNKQSIYPQMVAAGALTKRGQSRYDQLLAELGGQTPDFMPDLRWILRTDAEGAEPLYYQTDSHWNDFGAYLAFHEMMKHLSAWFPEADFITHFDIISHVNGRGGNTGRGGDLAHMMMRRDLRESYPQFAYFRRDFKRLPRPCPLSDIPREPDRRSYLTRAASPDKKPRVLIFRDSFFVPMVPLVATNFDEALFLWKSYDQKNVEEALSCFKPDVVIEEIVERHMFDFILEKEKKPDAANISAGAPANTSAGAPSP